MFSKWIPRKIAKSTLFVSSYKRPVSLREMLDISFNEPAQVYNRMAVIFKYF